MEDQIPARRKWQSAIGLMCVYYPIVVYVNLRVRNLTYLWDTLPYLMIEFLISVLFTVAWLYIAEYIQHLFARRTNGKALINNAILSRIAQTVLTIIIAIIVVLLHQNVLSWIFGLYFRNRTTPVMSKEMIELRNRVGQGYFMLMAFAIYLLIINNRVLTQNYRINEQIQDIKFQAEQLQKEHVQAQFTALKNQVNPHFLFNSLSILSSLVHADVNLSVQFINQLAKSYRYILEQKDNELVPLQTELEFIKSYTFLLNIRFANKFTLQINVPENIRQNYQIAPLTLQLLIENAVKHNRMSEQAPLMVTLQAEDDNLIVLNTLQLRQDRLISTGVGLQNIINRYALLTNRPVSVSENQYHFIVKIPLLAQK